MVFLSHRFSIPADIYIGLKTLRSMQGSHFQHRFIQMTVETLLKKAKKGRLRNPGNYFDTQNSKDYRELAQLEDFMVMEMKVKESVNS